MSSDADILFVTVNKHETQALLEAFQEATGKKAEAFPVGDRVYRNLGTVSGTRVFHALSEMGSGGPGATQQTVEKGIRALDPVAVIAVGIAFGINETKQSIGDILVSRQLRLYDLQRAGREIVLRGDRPHASTRLINFFEGVIHTSWEGVSATAGVLLTGDKLVDDCDYRNQLVKFEPEALGGEMEGAGLYVACQEQKVDWIVIKAICDWGDGQKSKNKAARQKKAAKHAAEFVLHALQQAPLTRISPSHAADLAEIKALLGELKEGMEQQKATPQVGGIAAEQMDQDDRDIWKSLVETHFRVKRIFLLAEEHDFATYIQPIREQRDALEHIMRCMAFKLGASKAGRPANYGRENLRKALQHHHRAYFDTADWFSVTLRRGIREALEPYAPEAIAEAIPDWYQTLRPKVDQICDSIVQARSREDVTHSPLEAIEVYDSALTELSDIHDRVAKAAPTLAQRGGTSMSKQTTKKRRRFLFWGGD